MCRQMPAPLLGATPKTPKRTRRKLRDRSRAAACRGKRGRRPFLAFWYNNAMLATARDRQKARQIPRRCGAELRAKIPPILFTKCCNFSIKQGAIYARRFTMPKFTPRSAQEREAARACEIIPEQ